MTATATPVGGGDLCRRRFTRSAATYCPLLARATVNHGLAPRRLCALHAWIDFDGGATSNVVWDDLGQEPQLALQYRQRCAQMGIRP